MTASIFLCMSLLSAKRFILRMSFKMLKEFSFPLKLFGAFITFELFLPSVCSDMGIHIALFVEGFRAKRTLEWLFPCVNSLMVIQG